MAFIIMAVISVIGAFIGLFLGMTVIGAVLFGVILFLVKTIIGIILAQLMEDEIAGTLSLIIASIVLVIILLNFSVTPNKDERYVPETGIAASIDGQQAASIRDLPDDQPYYLQIKIAIKGNSIARNMMGNNDIPVVIEISNPEVGEISDPQNIQFCKETKPKEILNDKIVYYYTVVAGGDPKTAILDFKVTPKIPGSQIIKITYDKKVSEIYTKTATLEYK